MASMGETPALGLPLKPDHAPQQGAAQQRMAVVIGSGVSQVSVLADLLCAMEIRIVRKMVQMKINVKRRQLYAILIKHHRIQNLQEQALMPLLVRLGEESFIQKALEDNAEGSLVVMGENTTG